MLKDDFKFIATKPVSQERLNLGYADLSSMYPFSINTYSSKENYQKAVHLGYESDLVIIGSAPSSFIKKRIDENKLTFYYSERIFKEGKWKVLNPKVTSFLIKNHTINKNKKVYMLCASAYTAGDFNMVGAYIGKTYKWGYFPEVKQYNIDNLISRKRNVIPKLLWVGRFINWKHPDQAIKIANLLKKEGYHFTLDIIGTGELENSLKRLIFDSNLSDQVKILGSMKPEDVRKHMESSNIFLFTSDFNEGWGAVLNESMNSGCAVIASHAIGSVPFLINNNENGLIYKNGDISHLYQCARTLLDDILFRENLSIAAYKTLTNTWNARIATKRLLKLTESLIHGKHVEFSEGPLSKAIPLSNKYNY